MTLTRSDVSRLLEAHGLSPSRALGQNFVADPNTVRKIVRLAMVQPGDLVVEVGGGLGSLTLALLEAGARVTVVEKDRWLVPVLGEVLSERAPGAPVRVVQADAMVLDWPVVPLAVHRVARRTAAWTRRPQKTAPPVSAPPLDFHDVIDR